MGQRLDGRVDPARIAGAGAAVGDALVWDGMAFRPGPAVAPGTYFGAERYPSSGTLSGAPSTVNLTRTPLTDSLHLYVNGVLLDESFDYTLSGSTVTFLPGASATGDVITARYAYAATGGEPAEETFDSFSDDFNRADETLALPWRFPNGDVWDVTGNLAAYSGGGAGQHVALVRMSQVAVDVTLDLATITATSGLIFNAVDGETHYELAVNGSTSSIWRYVAGAGAPYGAVTGKTGGVGTYRVTMTAGGVLTVRRNNVVLGTDTLPVFSTGFYVGMKSGATGNRLDNFSAAILP